MAVLFACVVFLAVRLVWRGADEDASHLSFAQAAGFGIGQLIARDHPAGGKVIYLVPAAREEVIASQFQPHADGMALGFGGDALRVIIEVGEGAQVPRRMAIEMVGMANRSLADVINVCRKHPDAIALAAAATPSDLPTAGILSALPPLYVLDATADSRWPQLLKAGTVRGVVIRNPDADMVPMAEGLQPAADVFAQRFRILQP